ncbi:MAG: hypothetical protein PHE43_03300 [Candidatus Nanoarchaeia archaeon]|nr:hypothetical protein [Candidatus Nanoarchaeia archaeon]
MELTKASYKVRDSNYFPIEYNPYCSVLGVQFKDTEEILKKLGNPTQPAQSNLFNSYKEGIVGAGKTTSIYKIRDKDILVENIFGTTDSGGTFHEIVTLTPSNSFEPLPELAKEISILLSTSAGIQGFSLETKVEKINPTKDKI